MNLLRLIYILLVFTPLAGCALSGGPIEGRVLEEGTDKPIVGAIVVVRWKGDLAGFADSKTVCYHVASSVSDEVGRYFIGSWRKDTAADWHTWIINKEATVVAYKAGYAFPNQTIIKDDIYYLAPFKGTREERLDYFMRILNSTNCPSAGSSSKNLYPVYKVMYEYAKEISISNDDRKILDILRHEAAEVAVRSDEHITSAEMERKVNEYLMNNLK